MLALFGLTFLLALIIFVWGEIFRTTTGDYGEEYPGSIARYKDGEIKNFKKSYTGFISFLLFIAYAILDFCFCIGLFYQFALLFSIPLCSYAIVSIAYMFFSETIDKFTASLE